MLKTLANELLFELFDYFTVSHLLRAFRFLHCRFDKLIFTHLRNCHHLDFRSITKRDFDFICQYHLRSISHQINSLILSNNDETPQQVQLFLSYGVTLDQFTALRSLSLYQLVTDRVMTEVLYQCRDLPHLIHLKLVKCFIEDFSYIWRLPKLSHLYLDLILIADDYFHTITSISSSLQIIILEFYLPWHIMINILEYSPCLQCFHVYLLVPDYFYLSTPKLFPSIVTLKLKVNLSVVEMLETLLPMTPNLNSLTIETSFLHMDEYRLEHLITNYLPKLKVFQFKMEMHYDNIVQIQDQADNIFRSFQSDFWLYKHKWFIQCHWSSESLYKHRVLFYTWPYTCSNLFVSNGFQLYKSTNPDENDTLSYDQVYNIQYASCLIEHNKVPVQYFNHISSKQSFYTKFKKLFHFNSSKRKTYSLSNNISTNDSSLYEHPVQITSSLLYLFKPSIIPNFPNVHKLTITLPFDKYFWSIIPQLDQLNSLDVLLTTHCTDLSKLQLLLDQAPHLYSLTFGSRRTISKEASLTDLTSRSIRLLNLRDSDVFGGYSYYNIEQCIILSRSPLGRQCEVLLIYVKKRRSILYLVNNMINLRALNVQCEDDSYRNRTLLSKYDGLFYNTSQITKSTRNNEDLVQWLQHHLSSTVMIERDAFHGIDIRLWIR